ncbi:MAG: ABC transporter permease subunit [Clostridia bacterium]|nr:ABC transporter permease subunit [Clostridia bacterium]
MRTAYAFLKKEWMEYYRTGKLIIIVVIFALFGLMNPAIAKLTPFLMEQLASMEDSGMVITVSTVDASMSWMQFYKNIPMALVVMLLLFGGILTNELQKGTLIPVLTKGLSRWKVLLTKGINLIMIWTGGYWLCYGITYFYSDYYWDNSIMSNLFFTAFCYWLFGMMIMALMTLFSAMTTSFGGVVLGVGVIYFAMTLLGMIPKISSYLPIYLTSTSELLTGGNTGDYVTAIIITFVITIGAVIAGCMVFNKREI